jgi:D-amino-acid oxidase
VSVVVVGAGVVGLTTALCLAEAGHDVTIVAAEPPQQTTSRAAAAMWGSAFVGPPDAVPRWAAATLEELRELSADPDATGVRMTPGTLVSPRADFPPPPDLFPGIEMRPLGEVPAGYALAVEVVVPLVDMPRYLDYLLARFEAAGGALELRRLDSLSSVDAELVVNCAGVGARDLVGDSSLRASRGQHVIVENPGIDRFFMEPPLGGAWAAWHPHPDYVVLGGVAGGDDWNMEPDPAVADAILARCAAIEPRFADARVLEHRVGLRPERAAVRLERGPADGVIHNYGHGGSGVSLSWGCARDVVALATARRT